MLKIIIIAGPTAVGKSKLAIRLACEINGEIINADAMQVYKYLNIGTGKPSFNELNLIQHHLISIINPDEEINAGKFMNLADKSIIEISERNKIPIIVGGTGLYLRALTQGLSEIPEVPVHIRKSLLKKLESNGLESLYNRLNEVDPQSAIRLTPNDSQRILRALEVFEAHGKPLSSYYCEFPRLKQNYNALKIFLTMERKSLYQKIDLRVDNMLKSNFINEVKILLSMGYGIENRALRSPGYLEAIKYLNGQINYEKMVYLIKQKHRNYAKRQWTWFKKEKEYLWIEADKFDEVLTLAINFLNTDRVCPVPAS